MIGYGDTVVRIEGIQKYEVLLLSSRFYFDRA